ncbi:hypothetical protein FRC08_011965 [Ceratobasidium sp. 394]|nr:hypothetical protein FRC08_011965 [Ceratobasidium sp. 394]
MGQSPNYMGSLLVIQSLRLYITDPYAMGEILLKEQNGFERTESYQPEYGLGPRPSGFQRQVKFLIRLCGCLSRLHAAAQVPSTRPNANDIYEDSRISIQFNCVEGNGMYKRLWAKQVPLFNLDRSSYQYFKMYLVNNSQLVERIEHEVTAQGAEVALVNVFEWCHRCALDAVGRAGLGHDFQTLSGTESNYSKAIKHLL